MLYALKLNSRDEIVDVLIDPSGNYSFNKVDGWEVYEIEGEQTPQANLQKLVERDGKYYLEDLQEPLVDFAEEQQKMEAITRRDELLGYLDATDYVVIKMNEALINNDTSLLNSLKIEYADVLIARQSARTEINSIEEQLS